MSLDATYPRSHHAYGTRSDVFTDSRRLEDPQGTLFDLSDRPLVCLSTDHQKEVVVAGTDHALYSIDLQNLQRKPTTMYSKTSGHTDWVSSVCHISTGAVLSGGMDGLLCLWSLSRRHCTVLQRDNTHPISSVLSDQRGSLAFAASYSGCVEIYSDLAPPSNTPAHTSAIRQRAGGMNTPGTMSGIHPLAVLSLGAAGGEPVLTMDYGGEGGGGQRLVSGDKAGGVVVWDLANLRPLTRYRAHPGPVTNVVCLTPHLSLSTGTDGYVKLWDQRGGGAGGSGCVGKVKAHFVRSDPSVMGRGGVGGMVGGGRLAGRGRGRGAPAPVESERGVPVGVLGLLSPNTSPIPALVTGGGGREDSNICVIDPRTWQVALTLPHPANGVYSLCMLGEGGRAGEVGLMVGDGIGRVLCYALDGGAPGEDGGECLRYGLGGSGRGAVRGLTVVGRSVVAAGEDGKVLVYNYR
eukprot:gene24841-30017_t